MAEQNDQAFQVKVGPAENPVALEVHPAAGDLKPWDNESPLRAVKGRHSRQEAPLKVTGQAKYTYDYGSRGCSGPRWSGLRFPRARSSGSTRRKPSGLLV